MYCLCALVQLSYVSHCCKHYIIGHVIGHVSCESHVYAERDRERERESSRVSVRDRLSISAFVAGVVCLHNNLFYILYAVAPSQWDTVGTPDHTHSFDIMYTYTILHCQSTSQPTTVQQRFLPIFIIVT